MTYLLRIFEKSKCNSLHKFFDDEWEVDYCTRRGIVKEKFAEEQINELEDNDFYQKNRTSSDRGVVSELNTEILAFIVL